MVEYNTVPVQHYLVFLLITLVAVTSAGVARSNPETKKQEELGLYNSTDKVRILSNTNFKEQVLDTNHSILVEFYNSYCGHCRRFAPSYKLLAENLYDWRDVLPIAAIDCAEDDNNGICREYEIVAYPTLRYFGPAYQPSNDSYGKAIQSQDLSAITKILAQFIAAENKTSNMSSWPDLQAVQSTSALSLFEGLDSLKKYVILVYEPENSTVGIETILHFLRYPNIAVKKITDLEVAAKYQINGIKYKIATIDRQGSIVPYAPLHELSSSYKETIKSFLMSQHITEKPDTTHETTSTKPLQNTEAKSKHTDIIEEVKRHKHFVYRADLEMAIRNTLHNEIPKSPHISGEKLLALQRYLSVLEHYNPLSSSGRSLISQLATFVSQQNQELSGKDFENELKKLEKEYGPISTSKQYIGCIGSQPGLRGYTCALWQLFHFLSVQAANSDKSQEPTEVLQAMHGYVKYFFGCTHCSEHFQEMASRREISSISSKDEAILWLWAAHNEVNQRLAGDDATEDPEFPKIQFPSVTSCPQCYKQSDSQSTANSEEKWDKTHVLQFLKNIHNPEYVSRYGLENDELLHTTTLDKLRQKRMISNVFSDMDMRMGMLLYGFCIVMLVVAFKLFAFKGGYRKKAYAHDMLGKV